MVITGVYFFSGYFTTVRFDREHIEARVIPGQIEVTGLYHYSNPSLLPAVLTLRVPFPVDGDHPPPSFYSVCEADEAGRCLSPVALWEQSGDVRFRLFFSAGGGRWVRVDYFQRARVENGRYLLTTTRPWRRPIAQADFTLHLTGNLQLVSSNYVLTDSGRMGGSAVYTFSRREFFPEQDWVFSWRGPPEGS